MEELSPKESLGRNHSQILAQNSSGHEFRTKVIRQIGTIETSVEDTRETLAAEIKDLRTSHNELKNAITQIQNKPDTVTARMEEAEERIGNRR